MSVVLQQILMAGGLRVSVSGAPASGGCGSPGPGSCSATTSSVTAVTTGGSGSYTYAWQFVSGTTAGALAPTNVTTAFSRSAAKALGGNAVSGVYRVQVTDTPSGLVATSAGFNVNTVHTDTT